MVNELSIIIPTLNEEKYIGRLLESISRQDFTGKLQVIIVDGNSDDHTIEITIEYKNIIPDLKIILSKKRRISIQRNKGAKEAKYEYLLFLDADVVIPKNFIRKLLLKINPNQKFVATTFLLLTDIDFWTFLIMLVAYLPSVLISRLRKISSGFCTLTTAENHNKIGGFREDLKYAEDADYGERSRAGGAKFIYFFYPYIYYSVRRLNQTGRIKWLFERLKESLIKEDPIKLQEKLKYPYGIFNKQKSDI